jgi:polyferredoxin
MLSKHFKLKIYLTLFVPFVLGGIGLLSFISWIVGESMTNKHYLMGVGAGMLMWYLETTIVVSMMERYVEKNHSGQKK